MAGAVELSPPGSSAASSPDGASIDSRAASPSSSQASQWYSAQLRGAQGGKLPPGTVHKPTARPSPLQQHIASFAGAAYLASMALPAWPPAVRSDRELPPPMQPGAACCLLAVPTSRGRPGGWRAGHPWPATKPAQACGVRLSVPERWVPACPPASTRQPAERSARVRLMPARSGCPVRRGGLVVPARS